MQGVEKKCGIYWNVRVGEFWILTNKNRVFVIVWLELPRDVIVYRLKMNDGDFFHQPV